MKKHFSILILGLALIPAFVFTKSSAFTDIDINQYNYSYKSSTNINYQSITNTTNNTFIQVIDSDCKEFGDHAYYLGDGYCKCMPGYFFSENAFGQTECLDMDNLCKVNFGNKSAQSPDDSTKCICQDGYTFVEDSLGKETCKTVDEYCQNEHGEKALYNETDDTCVCQEGYFLSEFSYSKPEWCMSCSSIFGFGTFYNFQTGDCECKDGYLFDEDKKECSPVSEYCKNNHGNISIFDESEGKCICKEGYVMNYYSLTNTWRCARDLTSDDDSNSSEEDESYEDNSDDDISISKNPFSDISQSYRFKNAVLNLQERGVLNGYQDGTFKPDQGVTRAEFLKIVLEGETPSSEYDTNCFNDIEAGTWYAPYVCKAKSEGWVNGYPDGGFHPNDNITQAEAMKISFLIKEVETDSPIEGDQWFWPLILKTKERGFLPNDILNQNQKISRGEVSELIWNIIK